MVDRLAASRAANDDSTAAEFGYGLEMLPTAAEQRVTDE
jgi:hypothetical protein